mgnify:CR=1 FL=1
MRVQITHHFYNTFIYLVVTTVLLIATAPIRANSIHQYHDNIFGIITPMPSEAKPFDQLISDKTIIKKNGATYIKGKIGTSDVVLVKSGIGKINAASNHSYYD